MVISGKTACFCLERLFSGAARLTCAPASDHLHSDPVSLEQVIDWAHQRGLDANLSHLSWGELRDAILTTPVLLILKNGNSVLALRNGESVEEIVVADPLYEDGQEFLLPRHLLEPAWGGETLTSLPVPVQRKSKLLVSGLGLCTAALTLGLAFTATDLQNVARSFGVSANFLANSDGEAQDHVADNSSTEDIASLARSDLKGSENPNQASVKAEVDTQTGFKAGASLSAAIDPDGIGSNSAVPGSDVSISESSAWNSDMHPDSENQHLMPKPQDNGTRAASELLSRDTQEGGRPTSETGPEPQVALAPIGLDSTNKSADVERGNQGPSNAADPSVSKRSEANTSSTEIEADELHHDTAGSESTNLSRSADSATSHTPEQLPLSYVESAALISRGDVLMGTGDLASARQFYERAADHGDGRAALRMGETYDPGFLAKSRIDGARGDALLAARWYLRALELGVPDAAVLFKAVVSADRH
jgi:hypothetical protein